MIIVASPDALLEFSHDAWRRGGIELVGPVRPLSFCTELLDRAIGVAIDVMEPPEEVFPIVTALEHLSVPFVFVVLDHAVEDDGPFLFNNRPGDIRTIIDALIGQQCSGVRH